MSAIHVAVRQGSDEWLAARRELITATDIPVLLGLSPYKCEADLAAEKRDGAEQGSNLRMRIGKALEDLIADEYERSTGATTRRFLGLVRHPSIEWAAASPDRRVVGTRKLVELKWTGSRRRFEDGLPQDVEAQVAWQLGIVGWPAADVAALVGDELRIYPVEADQATFEGLVEIASDFRARLAAGGPFAESADSLKRRYPADNGAEMVADAELEEAVRALMDARERRRSLEEAEAALETAIKARMAEAAVLTGDGWRVTWKRSKDAVVIDWKSVADGLLRQLPETEARSLVGIATTVRPGFRPFRVVSEKGDRE